MIIKKEEYHVRLQKLQERMRKDSVDMFIIYGDEFRRENLRYMANY